MYKGYMGFCFIVIVKTVLTLIIMYSVLGISYLIGYYDTLDFSFESEVGLTDFLGNLLETDLTYYGAKWFSEWGTLGTVFGAALGICVYLCGGDFTVTPDIGTTSLYVIITVVMTTIFVSVTVKLYLKMAERLNRRCSGGVIQGLNIGVDILSVLVIVYLGILCTGCLTRRAMILTDGLSNTVLFIVYISLLLIVSLLLALIDSKLSKANFIKGFVNIACKMLYSVLISAESICVSATFLILQPTTDEIWTNYHFSLFGLMMFFVILLITTIYLSNRKAN